MIFYNEFWLLTFNDVSSCFFSTCLNTVCRIVIVFSMSFKNCKKKTFHLQIETTGVILQTTLQSYLKIVYPKLSHWYQMNEKVILNDNALSAKLCHVYQSFPWKTSKMSSFHILFSKLNQKIKCFQKNIDQRRFLNILA